MRFKKMLWIFGTIILLLAITYVMLAFKNGYRFPDRDKHPDWKEFPHGSNPGITITPVKDIYVSNLQAIPGTTDYMLFYHTDSTSFHDMAFPRFGIISNRGEMLASYNSQDVYYDDQRIIIKGEDSCDVYNIASKQFTKQQLQELSQVPASIKGLRAFEERAIYPGNTNRSRGYGLFTDSTGTLYTVTDRPALYTQCPDCSGYELESTLFVSKAKMDNISISDTPVLRDNDVRWGYTLGLGNPNGSGGGFYFFVNHTWMMYYTMQVGNQTTSFKAKGPEKDEPYISFYQLNKPQAGEPLLILAENRIWVLSATH